MNNRKKITLTCTTSIVATVFVMFFVNASVQFVDAQTTTALPPKKNVYPTVATTDVKLPTVILSDDQGKSMYLRLQNYADGKGGGVNYPKFRPPTQPELTLKSGHVFTLQFTNGQIPQLGTYFQRDLPQDQKPIRVGFDPSLGSDVRIDSYQLIPKNGNTARFYVESFVPEDDDESIIANGQEQIMVTLNFGNVNGQPLWVNYVGLINVQTPQQQPATMSPPATPQSLQE